MSDEFKWTKWDGQGRRREHLEGLTCQVIYLGTFSSGGGYQASSMNQAILNFKIVRDASQSRQRYKLQSIDFFSQHLEILKKHIEKPDSRVTWVPSSKLQTDPLYDDRHHRLLRKTFRAEYVVEIVRKIAATSSLHNQEGKRLWEPIYESLAFISPDLTGVRRIFIFDDVLTSGASFKAVATHIWDHYPEMEIVGVFLAFSEQPYYDR